MSGGQIFAAGATKEQRVYAAAVSAFQDAMWSRAETGFAQFVQKFPDSANVPQALLLQAQAEFKQGKFAQAIALMQLRGTEAGSLTDQYVYWIGEAQFQSGDFSAAAKTFALLGRNFPDSSLKLRAAVESAAALAQLNDWPQVEKFLEETNGVFQRATQLDSGNEMISRGRLLLAQAKFAQNDFGGASAILESINLQTLQPELDWPRAFLFFQIKLALGDLNAALTLTTNLAQLGKNDGDLRAQSAALRAGVLEKLNRAGDAIAAYRENLTNTAPEEQQRQAVLKIAELSIAQKQFPVAETNLENFIAQFPRSPAAGIALFTLGELYLKDYAEQPAAATNQLQAAQACFDKFLAAFTNSPLAGKAYLDRGWCKWLPDKNPGSLGDFKMAVEKLPPSGDLAVARFKLGDVLFARDDYAGALRNYRAALDDFTNFPEVTEAMKSLALYQIVRANLQLNDVAGASNAMAQVLEFYPASPVADNSLLLVGEGYEDLNRPATARHLFQKFQEMYPTMPLRSQVELAIARTYEQEGDWPAAITHYQNWLARFPTNTMWPQADYALAQANFQAGDETNAFNLFTNFAAQFPTDELAPLAQWWVADYYFRASGPDHFVNAERNYKFIFQNTNWQSSPLVYEAQMMAGRAAIGWGGYKDAIDLFTTLVADTNCPPDLSVQARFGLGGALMSSDSSDTNNPLANFQSATNVFGQICRLYPTNAWGALAWGETGDCDLQLNDFDAATNAYAQVFNSPFANISARSQAQIGFGIALEKKADLLAGGNQANLNLRRLALDDHYLKVFDTWTGKNLRDGETADPFWVKKAGLQALPLVEMLGAGDANKFIDQMEELFPQAKDSLEKKRGDLAAAKK